MENTGVKDAQKNLLDEHVGEANGVQNSDENNKSDDSLKNKQSEEGDQASPEQNKRDVPGQKSDAKSKEDGKRLLVLLCHFQCPPCFSRLNFHVGVLATALSFGFIVNGLGSSSSESANQGENSDGPKDGNADNEDQNKDSNSDDVKHLADEVVDVDSDSDSKEAAPQEEKKASSSSGDEEVKSNTGSNPAFKSDLGNQNQQNVSSDSSNEEKPADGNEDEAPAKVDSSSSSSDEPAQDAPMEPQEEKKSSSSSDSSDDQPKDVEMEPAEKSEKSKDVSAKLNFWPKITSKLRNTALLNF